MSMAIAPYYRLYELPWSPTEAVEKRFRNIVRNLFILFGLLALLITFMPMPEKDLARLLRDARRGKTRIDLDLKRLDQFGKQLDSTLDRATMGIMTASLVIGSSIVMTVQSGPSLLGMPLFTVLGLGGYVVAFCNSVWIIFGIWRSGK